MLKKKMLRDHKTCKANQLWGNLIFPSSKCYSLSDAYEKHTLY